MAKYFHLLEYLTACCSTKQPQPPGLPSRPAGVVPFLFIFTIYCVPWSTVCNKAHRVVVWLQGSPVWDAAAAVGPLEGNKMLFFGTVKRDELGEIF